MLTRPNRDLATARVHLDAFADVAAQFAGSAVRPTLGGFLDWLTAAEEQEDGLEMPTLEITPERSRCSPATPPRAWSGMPSPYPAWSRASSSHGAQVSDKSGFWTLGQVNDSGWLVGLEGAVQPAR